MADFQRTFNSRLMGIYDLITVSPFCLQLRCITIQKLTQIETESCRMKNHSSSVGAASSAKDPEDAAPDGAREF
jgi:hypothetical protein